MTLVEQLVLMMVLAIGVLFVLAWAENVLDDRKKELQHKIWEARIKKKNLETELEKLRREK